MKKQITLKKLQLKLKRKMLSEEELFMFLTKEGLPKEKIYYLMYELNKGSFVNDSLLAKDIVLTLDNKLQGKGLILKELNKRKINAKVISKISFEHEVKKLNTLYNKLIKKYSKYSFEDAIKRVNNTFVRKGFYKEDISKILNDVSYDINFDRASIKYWYQKALRKYKILTNKEEYKEKVINYLLSKGYTLSLVEEVLNNNER